MTVAQDVGGGGGGPALFPVGDWEFWVATAVVAVLIGLGLWRVLRTPWKRRRRSSRATLTVEGKAVAKSSQSRSSGSPPSHGSLRGPR